MTVYIDALFLTNMILNSVIVLCAEMAFRDRIRALKTIAGGAALALYSVVMFFPHTRLLYTALGKIFCTALFTLVYFRPSAVSEWIRRTAAFFALSLIICGAAFAAAAGLLKGGTVSNGVPYFDIDFKKLLLAAGFAFIVIKAAADMFSRNLSRCCVDLTVTADGRETSVKALIDTGCEAREPISGKPVVIIRGKSFESGIPVAVSTVTSSGIIYAKKAERIECSDRNFGIDADRCLIAFVDAKLSGSGLYGAVAPPEAFYIKRERLNSGGYKMNLQKLKARVKRAYLKHISLKAGKVNYIGGSDTLPPPLDKDEEQIWIARLREPDFAEEAKRLLIEHNLRLVVYIAKRFDSTGIGIEDLISIGTIGLIKAINTFKAEKKIKLATYASRCIENEILMFLRKNSNAKTEISIDEPLNVDWDGKELLLSDILGTDGDVTQKNIEDETDRELLKIALDSLGSRERSIVEMRYGLGRGGDEMTQKEVADLLGISQSYISRLEKRIIKRLRKDMTRMLTS